MPNGKPKAKQPTKSLAPKAVREVAKAASKAVKAERTAALKAIRHDLGKTNNRISSAVENIVLEHDVEKAKAVELAKALCCPNMFPSFGVQDGYSSFPSADATPFMVEPASLGLTASGTDNLGIDYTEGWAAAYRDPRCSLRMYDGGNRTFDYIFVPDSGTRTNDWDAEESCDFDYAIYNTGFEAHGPILYAGEVKSGPGSGTRFFPAHSEQQLNMDGFPNSTPVECKIDVLKGDEVVTYRRSATTSGAGLLSLNLKDFTQVNDPTTSLQDGTRLFMIGNIRFDTAITAGECHLAQTLQHVLRQLCLADWEDVEDVIDKIRFPALNLMYSNTAPVLSRNGFAAAWQVPSNIDFVWLMQQGFQHLANKPGAERMEANEGIHIFWKSTDPLDWEYLEVGNADGGVSPSSYIISADSDYLAIALTIPVVDGRAGYWSVFSDVQYRHESVWFNTHFPDHNRRTFEYALELQARVPQVHSNPFHIKDIFKWIGQHKGQVNGTLDLINETSNYRAGPVINPLKKFLDVWFK